MKTQFGSFVISTAGHDKGRIFVILRTDSEYVYLMNGIDRTFEKPKKKNKKHIDIISYEDEYLKVRQKDNKPIRNEDIKRAIKILMQSGVKPE